MDKKSQDFSEVLRLMNSPAGQQLLATLKKADTGQIQQAMNAAGTGDYASAQNAIRPLLADPELQALLRQLGGK